MIKIFNFLSYKTWNLRGNVVSTSNWIWPVFQYTDQAVNFHTWNKNATESTKGTEKVSKAGFDWIHRLNICLQLVFLYEEEYLVTRG